MRVIITGSKVLVDIEWVIEAVQHSGFSVTEIITGNRPGVERCAVEYAKSANIPYRVFSPDWDTHKREAGRLCSAEMVSNADAVIGLIAGGCAATSCILKFANEKQLKIFSKQLPIWGYKKQMTVSKRHGLKSVWER